MYLPCFILRTRQVLRQVPYPVRNAIVDSVIFGLLDLAADYAGLANYQLPCLILAAFQILRQVPDILGYPVVASVILILSNLVAQNPRLPNNYLASNLLRALEVFSQAPDFRCQPISCFTIGSNHHELVLEYRTVLEDRLPDCPGGTA